jgi:hypothetical protein
LLRNSLAYFPVAATEMLDQSGRHFSAQSRD